ncbi:MAG: DUF4139 domain-containing protein [Saprospiraceae bacterium]|nr:DUF4139 domain-containing protein [Saprospiraceae bacterium]MBK9720586.1 DUF4139 domain-containing protein [Saprospiraceae bacterium]
MNIKSIFLMSLFATSLQSQSVVSSEIKEVNVYLQGAQVRRQIELKLNQGLQEISIKGLAQFIDPNSIRVIGSPDFIIQGVRHELNFIQAAEEKTLELKKKRDGLLDDAAKLNQQLSILKFEKTSLEKNQVQIMGVPNSNQKLEDLKTLIDFQKLRLQDLLPKIYELDKKHTLVQIEIEKVNRQIQDFDQNQTPPSSELVLSILSKTAGVQKFSVLYYVSNASWSMNYDILVKDITSPLELIYKATIFQATGEDWKNVKLSLSTANPFEGGVRPELNPWYLKNQPPMVYTKNQRGAPRAQNQAMETMADGAASVMDVITESEQITSRVYSIDLPYTVLSNNKPFLVEIKKASVPAKYTYFAVPKLDRDAFLTAEVQDWEDLNLMDGEANLFFEGNYQGKSYINTQSINDFLRLSLGRDKNITIERNKIKDFSKNKFLSDKKIVSKAWEIVVKNKKNSPIDLIVEDQLPISTQKEILVEKEDISGAEYNEETGKLRWVLKVAAGEQKKLKIKYNVESPKDYILNLE